MFSLPYLTGIDRLISKKKAICKTNPTLTWSCVDAISTFNWQIPGECLFPQQAPFHLQLYHLAPNWNIHLHMKISIMLAKCNMTETYRKRENTWKEKKKRCISVCRETIVNQSPVISRLLCFCKLLIQSFSHWMILYYKIKEFLATKKVHCYNNSHVVKCQLRPLPV